jgi:alkylhydroperoxidase family enzyme
LSRIEPLQPPYEPSTGEHLTLLMPPGADPIALFRVLARNMAMSEAMSTMGRYELGRSLSLSMRDREIVIDRTCALTGCEYEWGVHVAFFADRVGLTHTQIASLTHGDPSDACWTDERERLILRSVDALHRSNDIDDVLWTELVAVFTVPELLDLLVLTGWYHVISNVASAARLTGEPGAPTFADFHASGR